MNTQDREAWGRLKIHGIATPHELHGQSIQSVVLQAVGIISKCQQGFRGKITLELSPTPILDSSPDAGLLEGLLETALGSIPEAGGFEETLTEDPDLRQFWACSSMANLDKMNPTEAIQLFGRVKDKWVLSEWWDRQLQPARGNFFERFGIE